MAAVTGAHQTDVMDESPLCVLSRAASMVERNEREAALKRSLEETSLEATEQDVRLKRLRGNPEIWPGTSVDDHSKDDRRCMATQTSFSATLPQGFLLPHYLPYMWSPLYTYPPPPPYYLHSLPTSQQGAPLNLSRRESCESPISVGGVDSVKGDEPTRVTVCSAISVDEHFRRSLGDQYSSPEPAPPSLTAQASPSIAAQAPPTITSKAPPAMTSQTSLPAAQSHPSMTTKAPPSMTSQAPPSIAGRHYNTAPPDVNRLTLSPSPLTPMSPPLVTQASVQRTNVNVVSVSGSVDDHFSKALGKVWSDLIKPPEKPKEEDDDVDCHFSRALGDTWRQLKERQTAQTKA